MAFLSSMQAAADAGKEKVIIIGAGISGLAAARDLEASGYEVLVLEARDRIGGRIWTDRSTGTNLDLGASWIHGIDNNPVKALADEIKTPLSGIFDYDNTSTFDADGTEDPVADSALESFDTTYRQYAAPHISNGDDISVQAVIDEAVADGAYSDLPARAVTSLVNTIYEHEYSGAANDISIHALEEGEDQTGGDVLFLDGYDNITNHLATGIDIRLQAVVSKISHDASRVSVETSRGNFTGDRVVVTVPLGVLKAGSIIFEPALPADKQSAISRLGMGVLNKVWLEFPSVFWDATDVHNYFSTEKGRFNEWVNWEKASGKKYLLGFNAAAYGIEIEKKSDTEIVAEAMTILRTIWGNGIPEPSSHVITRWDSDPYAKGAYSFLKVGSMTTDRDTLAAPIDNRVFFAGEATDKDHAATTHGAYNSGVREAARIVALGNQDSDGDGVRDLDDAFPADASKSSRVYRATQFLQTTSTSANVTSIHIINSSGVSQTFTGSLYNGSGERLGAVDVALSASPVSPNGRLVLSSSDLEKLVGADPWSGPAMLEVSGKARFDLMAKLISPSGLVSNTNCVRENRVLNIEPYGSSNQTFIRFINTGDTAIGAIKGTLYDSAGAVIGSPDTQLLSGLAAKEAVWITRQQFADLTGVQWQTVAMLEVDTHAGLKLLNLNLVNGETFFNFSCFESSDSARLFIQTTSTSKNVSFTHIVNTSDVAQTFRGTLYGGDGAQLGEAGQLLHSGEVAPKGRVIVASTDLESAFSVSPWSGPAIVEVTGQDSFEIMTKLTSPSGLVSNTNCVRQDQIHNIEPPGSSDRTFVRLVNLSDKTLYDIVGNLFASDGSRIGKENTILSTSLAPRSAVWLSRDDLSTLVGDTWSGAASLRLLSAPAELRLLNLNLINSETFFNFSCYETAG